MNPVGQQLVLSGIVPFRANMITWQSIVMSLWTNMVVQAMQLESRFSSSKDGWRPHSRGLDDKIFFVAFQRKRKAYQSTSLLQQSETLQDARSVPFLFFCLFVLYFFRVSFPKREPQLGLSAKLAFLKKRPDPPPWDRSWAQDACSRAARSAVFKRNGGRSLSPLKKVIQQFYWFILEFLQD